MSSVELCKAWNIRLEWKYTFDQQFFMSLLFIEAFISVCCLEGGKHFLDVDGSAFVGFNHHDLKFFIHSGVGNGVTPRNCFFTFSNKYFLSSFSTHKWCVAAAFFVLDFVSKGNHNDYWMLSLIFLLAGFKEPPTTGYASQSNGYDQQECCS